MEWELENDRLLHAHDKDLCGMCLCIHKDPNTGAQERSEAVRGSFQVSCAPASRYADLTAQPWCPGERVFSFLTSPESSLDLVSERCQNLLAVERPSDKVGLTTSSTGERPLRWQKMQNMKSPAFLGFFGFGGSS